MSDVESFMEVMLCCMSVTKHPLKSEAVLITIQADEKIGLRRISINLRPIEVSIISMIAL